MDITYLWAFLTGLGIALAFILPFVGFGIFVAYAVNNDLRWWCWLCLLPIVVFFGYFIMQAGYQALYG